MSTSTSPRCPSDLLSETIRSFGAEQAANLSLIDALLMEYPGDGKLHFLRGSLLAGLERYGEARTAMETAVRLQPDYGVARFQLGFLELTSGDPSTARETWRPLRARPESDPLHLFVCGLEHLIEDRFPEAVDFLRRGIALNTDLEPMNHDMRLLIGKMEEALDQKTPSPSGPLSTTHLLLQQYGAKGSTRH